MEMSLRKVIAKPGMMVLVVLFFGGCGPFPRDPEETLSNIRSGGTMRVGVVENPPWTSFDGDGPGGVEVELVERFAAELGSEIAWIRGGESELMRELERFELDLVIGGLTKDSPWSKRVGFSRVYFSESREGKKEEHVIAVPPGENGWVMRLDRFLKREGGGISGSIRQGGEAG